MNYLLGWHITAILSAGASSLFRVAQNTGRFLRL